jgi:predicted DNA-binding transcriptional regulator YafY
MSRSARLLNLIQCLRARRRPVTAATLADELGISLRTVYRDVATLVGEGVPIEGEAGLGYVLRPGFLLPPLMFGDDEIDAIVLGLRWVSQRGDKSLAAAARDAGAKIITVLPPDLREKAENAGLVSGTSRPPLPSLDLTPLRRAIREERKLRLSYADANGRRSERVVWPFALAFFEHVRVLATWCETRRDFRHFRTDRIADATMLGERYPRRRRVLVSDWRAREGMGEQL